MVLGKLGGQYWGNKIGGQFEQYFLYFFLLLLQIYNRLKPNTYTYRPLNIN